MDAHEFLHLIEADARELGYTDPVWLALLMAVVEQECVTRDKQTGEKIATRLATQYHNLGGVKYQGRSDEGRYDRVQLGANEFENTDQVYRVYPDWQASLKNIRWHFVASSNYAIARRAFFAKLREVAGVVIPPDIQILEGQVMREVILPRVEATRAFIDSPANPGDEMARTWCSVNPNHPREVVGKFEAWLKRLA